MLAKGECKMNDSKQNMPLEIEHLGNIDKQSKNCINIIPCQKIGTKKKSESKVYHKMKIQYERTAKLFEVCDNIFLINKKLPQKTD